MSSRNQTIKNQFISLAVDRKGKIVSFYNKATKTELIAFPEHAEAWRMVVPTGQHTIAFIRGSEQKPARINRRADADGQSLHLEYDGIVMGRTKLPVQAQFAFYLKHDDPQVTCGIQLDNRSRYSVDEVEFPIIGGLGGFGTAQKKELQLVQSGGYGKFHGDVLNGGLPENGLESHHFVREHETCMFSNASDADEKCIYPDPIWLDLGNESQGIYAGYHPKLLQLFAFKLEKYPKEVPHNHRHAYPKDTPRWLRLQGLHMPRVQPGKKWISESVVLAPHAGGWQAGVNRVAPLLNDAPPPCATPAWMNDFVGWTEIIGNLYTGEIFHDYAQCAEKIVQDARVTGINFVFYYGHTSLGAEGADFDNGPCEILGGEKGFRRMVEKLHRHGIRIMLLDHLHRWVNRVVPEVAQLGLERWAMRDPQGNLNTARWWKETGLSCLYLKGPTPEWIEMCPACPEWRAHYLTHVKRMIDLGVDAVELDVFNPGRCSTPGHPHEPGIDLFPVKLDFIREVRAQTKRLNPDFAFFAETAESGARSVVDGFYNRYLGENGRIQRYLYPQIHQQAVLVGNYAYDQVNKALQLGIGVETEIWGLRKTTLEGCPELAAYIGEVNRFKRRYPHLLIHGIFRDTLGARCAGNVIYSVLESPGRDRALVLRNPANPKIHVEAALDSVKQHDAVRIWQPFKKERRVKTLPITVHLEPYGVAVLLACAGYGTVHSPQVCRHRSHDVIHR